MTQRKSVKTEAMNRNAIVRLALTVLGILAILLIVWGWTQSP